jgi:hypothetical protein
MSEFRRSEYKKFLDNTSKKLEHKSNLTDSDLEFLFYSLIELHGIPLPPTELEPYFIHPNIISDLFIEVINSSSLTSKDRKESRKSFESVHNSLEIEKTNYSITFRILAPGGRYPNVTLQGSSCKYKVNNQFPVLVTKNKNKKDLFADRSLVNWLTRNELKFATSVICAPESGLYHFHFTGHNKLEVDNHCLKNVPETLRIYFLRELLDIQRRFTPIGVRPWHRKPLPDVNEYEFDDYNDSIQTFQKIFNSFDIQDDLLLRTSNYFVKAIMHWDNPINAEEAITNTFFCLEGCLHLIQKKYEYFSPKLNLELIKKVFKNEIPYGENLFEFIREGYDTRITLVHAEPEWGSEWDPFVTSEDFYEYFKLCRILLNFVLIDRITKDLG